MKSSEERRNEKEQGLTRKSITIVFLFQEAGSTFRRSSPAAEAERKRSPVFRFKLSFDKWTSELWGVKG